MKENECFLRVETKPLIAKTTMAKVGRNKNG